MRRTSIYLFWLFTAGMVSCEEVTLAPSVSETPTNLSESESNSTHSNDDPLSDEYPVWEQPEVLLDSASGVDVSGGSKTKNGYKPLAVHFIQKFSNWMRPVYEKFSRIKDFLVYPDHPNYGGAVDQQQLLERWQEKRHHFLTGIAGAVYGLAPLENHDYPFAYRGLKEKSRKIV